ncbi:hypothetical protein B484DRAFT_399477 [Ochromonadaceae sp. CCMP2298]|nr:hypothetical protein B484DRAFT_399477 [Ochromonadaceae sp. CCMP2298]
MRERALAEARAVRDQPLISDYVVVAPDFEERLIRWIVGGYHSASEVENELFRDMIAAANPKIKCPSTRRFWKLANSEAAKAQVALEEMLKGERVSLTTDTWTSITAVGKRGLVRQRTT